MLFLKGDSSPEHFSFFLFYFNVSNKISFTPRSLLNFQEFSTSPSPVYSNPPVYQVLNNFSIRNSRARCELYLLMYFIFFISRPSKFNSMGSPPLHYILVCKIHIYRPKITFLSRLT